MFSFSDTGMIHQTALQLRSFAAASLILALSSVSSYADDHESDQPVGDAGEQSVAVDDEDAADAADEEESAANDDDESEESGSEQAEAMDDDGLGEELSQEEDGEIGDDGLDEEFAEDDDGTEEESVVVEQEEPQDELFTAEGDDIRNAGGSIGAIEEVIVTSTKRETSLLTTPVAVSAFSQDDLDRQKILDVTDIADLIPNLTIGESPSDSGVTISVRGISSNNFTEIGDPTVGVHVDGIFTPRPQAALALLHDNLRIEVNRGPQGTLFGRNSTAGSINIITSRPQFDEYAGTYEMEYGSFDQFTVRGWTNLALSDGFAARFSFMYDVSGTYFNQSVDRYDFAWDDNGDGDFNDPYDVAPDGIPNLDQRRAREVDGKDAYGGKDRYGVRLSTLLSTSDSYKWLLSADYFRDSSPGSFSVKDCEKAEGTFFACEGSQWDVNINNPGALDFRLFTVRNELIYDFTDNLRMELRVGFSRQFRDQYYDSDGGARAAPGHPAYGLSRNAGGIGVSEGHSQRYPGEPVSNLIRGGPNGDNQYILDTLDFSGYALSPWDDLLLITRYSNYDSRVYELQFSSIADPDNAVEWIGGIFLMQEDNGIRFDVESPAIGDDKGALAQSFEQPNRDVRSTAAFGQIDIPFSERFRMTFGTRWTLDSKSDIGGQSYASYSIWTAPYAYTSPPGETIDYFASADDPTEQIGYQSYHLVGIVEDVSLLQSNDLTLNQGTYAPDLQARVRDKNPNLLPNTFEDFWAQWTWKVGFDFVVNDRFFWYGYIATGYKAGGFTDVVDLCANLCGNYPQLNAFPYDPEQNLTYETGIKSTLFDSERVGSMNLIVTAFVSNVRDYQVTVFANNLTAPGTIFTIPRDLDDPERAPDNLTRDVTVPSGVSNLVTYNIGRSRSSGLEIELDWSNPWPGGKISGWLTLLNAEVLDLPSVDGYFCFERAYLGLTPCPAPDLNLVDSPDTPEDDRRVVNFRGNKLPWSPEYALTLNFEHRWEFGNSGISFTPYLSMHWSDEYFFDINNFDEGALHNGQLPYWSFDMSLRLVDDKRNWRVEIYGHNLSDKRVRTWGDQGPGFVRSSFNAPRNFGMKVVWGF